MNARRAFALAVLLTFAAVAPAAAATPARAGAVPKDCIVDAEGASWVCSEGGTLTGAKPAAGRTVEPLSFLGGTVFDKWTWKYNDIIWYGLGPNPTQGTLIGKVRVVASLSLNGRKAQSSWVVTVFTGPSIIARTKTRCLDDNSPTWLPDTVCAENWVYQTTHTRSAINNFASPYLSEDERYWFEYSVWFKPSGFSNPSTSDGYWYLPNQPLMSAAFSCSATRAGSQVCIFG